VATINDRQDFQVLKKREINTRSALSSSVITK
jgi:hypothetical protein